MSRTKRYWEDREEVKEFGVEEENKKFTAELQAIL
jgi:hypothetical protein